MGPRLETLLATAWLLPARSPALCMVLPVALRLQLEGAVCALLIRGGETVVFCSSQTVC